MSFWTEAAKCQFCGEMHTWSVAPMWAGSNEWDCCVNRVRLLRTMVGRFGKLGGAVREIEAQEEVVVLVPAEKDSENPKVKHA